MIAILGGLGAATAFAAATLCAAKSSRLIGAAAALGWVMIVGFVVAAPAAAAGGIPDDLDAAAAGWLAAAGLGNVLGLLLLYSALRIGKVGIVAPLASTEGAVAAVIAVLAGESVSPGTGVALGAIVCGVVLASLVREEPGDDARGRHLRAAAYALAAALAFGTSLYATGRVSEELPLPWAVLPARAAGVVFIALPLALTRSLTLTRRALPFVVAGGLCEVLGFASYALGARHGIAISAVLASQFAALAAVGAYVLLRERLAPPQVLGVAIIAAGVAALAALEA